MAGIYIHIPYCRQACHYCNFHFSTNLKSKEALITAICHEIRSAPHDLTDSPIASVYLGGGTPSILDHAEIEALFLSLHRSYHILPDAEITLEANPEDISHEKLKIWYEQGVNRLSIGIQSFHDKDLVHMNRAHNASQAKAALDIISCGPIKNITADLMFGLIDSTLEDWNANLLQLLSYDIQHISVYNLTIEEQTVYAHHLKKENIKALSDDYQYEQYLLAESILEKQGYEHYEISNYAKSGYRAKHNTSYWDRIDYLGFGPSAHSLINNVRLANPAHNQTYLANISDLESYREQETLSNIDIYNELIMLGLRRWDGIDEMTIQQLDALLWQRHQDQTKGLILQGIVTRQNHRLILDRSQWFLSDHISSSLFLEET